MSIITATSLKGTCLNQSSTLCWTTGRDITSSTRPSSNSLNSLKWWDFPSFKNKMKRSVLKWKRFVYYLFTFLGGHKVTHRSHRGQFLQSTWVHWIRSDIQRPEGSLRAGEEQTEPRAQQVRHVYFSIEMHFLWSLFSAQRRASWQFFHPKKAIYIKTNLKSSQVSPRCPLRRWRRRNLVQRRRGRRRAGHRGGEKSRGRLSGKLRKVYGGQKRYSESNIPSLCVIFLESLKTRSYPYS